MLNETPSKAAVVEEITPIKTPVETPVKQQEEPKKVKKKPIVKKKDEVQYTDYTKLYNSFYDIFVGHQIDPKNFDLAYVVRETRNMYASFVNLMDTNAVLMK